MSLFEGEKKDDKQGESEADGSKNEQTGVEKEDNTASKPSRKEMFEQLYRKHINDNYKKRKRAIIQGLLPHSKDYDDAKLFTELNLRRKRNNLIARRIRMTRKANLQDFTHFVTLTYSNELHTKQAPGLEVYGRMGAFARKTAAAFPRYILYSGRHDAGADDRRERL